jgi:DNA polymerase III delta subunit
MTDGRAGSARGGSGAALLDRVTSALAKQGWPAGLTLLTGEDLFHLDRAQRALLEALAPGVDRDYALTVYGDGEVDVSVVVAAARSVGMFAAARVVLVRELTALGGRPEPLEEYAARPPAGSYLIVRAPKLDRRRKLDAVVASRARVLSFEPLSDPQEAAPYVRELATAAGLALEPEAARLLALLSGGDCYRIEAELAKLAAWCGEARRAGLDELRQVVAGSEALTGWELADAVVTGDRTTALLRLRELLDAGAEPLQLVGGLAFRARAMLQAKAQIDAGVPAERALGNARLFGRPRGELLSGLKRRRLAELAAFPALLLEADRALKGSLLPAAAVLERLVERLTPAAARAGRA